MRVTGEVARDRLATRDDGAQGVTVVGVHPEVSVVALARSGIPRVMVAEHEKGPGRRAGKLVEPIELLARDAPAVSSRANGVEHRESDAVDIDGEGPVRGDRFGDHRVVIAAEVAHALAETGVRAQERRVFLLGPAIGEITLHEHRVGIERLDGVDRGPVHDLGIGLGAGLGGEDRPELLRCAEHTTLHLAEVDVVDGRDGGEQSAARLIQGRDLGREHR